MLGVGGVVIAVLLSFLSTAVFDAARAFLLLASGGLLIALALAFFLRPVRRALANTFVGHVEEGPAFSVARDEELRQLLRPLTTALLLLFITMAAMMLRAAY